VQLEVDLVCLLQDVELKVNILEWLSACIETQPGVVELFLNIEFDDDKNVGEKVRFRVRKELFSSIICFSACLVSCGFCVFSARYDPYLCLIRVSSDSHNLPFLLDLTASFVLLLLLSLY
jgi:hypothetical protein